jgi:hypothetical protein
MITVNVKDREIYFEDRNEFHTIEGGEFHLEHSLHSIAMKEFRSSVIWMTLVFGSRATSYGNIRLVNMESSLESINLTG